MEETWDRILSVKLKILFLACKHLLPVMRQQQSSCLINISSIAAICSMGLVAYQTSRAGVNGLTQTLAIGNSK